MDKTFSEAINGIRSAVMASEVREDIAQMGEYVEQFANTAITKAAEAAASAKTATDAAGNASAAVSAAIDPTLSVSGKAADAAKVGEAVNAETTRAKAAEEENAKGIGQIKEDLEAILKPNLFDINNFTTVSASPTVWKSKNGYLGLSEKSLGYVVLFNETIKLQKDKTYFLSLENFSDASQVIGFGLYLDGSNEILPGTGFNSLGVTSLYTPTEDITVKIGFFTKASETAISYHFLPWIIKSDTKNKYIFATDEQYIEIRKEIESTNKQQNNLENEAKAVYRTEETFDAASTFDIPAKPTKTNQGIFAKTLIKLEKLRAIKQVNSSKSVSTNGALRVVNGKIVNKSGEPIQLTGMSTFHIGLGSECYMHEGLESINLYGANLIRDVLYTANTTSGNALGYISDKEYHKKIFERVISDAISLDMYVLLDWHINVDGNPLTYLDEAKAFFNEMSKKYASTPNVLYEICNEPNGSGGTWKNIKKYANEIIPIIRGNASNQIIVIGTPNYSDDIASAYADPITGYENIMYTYHDYDRNYTKIQSYIDSKFPIFMTEWGIRDGQSGTGDMSKAKELIDWAKKNSVSWTAWALYQKRKQTQSVVSPFLQYGYYVGYGGWEENDLNDYGKIVFENF